MFTIVAKLYLTKGQLPVVQTLPGEFRLDHAIKQQAKARAKFEELGIKTKFTLVQVPGTKIH